MNHEPRRAVSSPEGRGRLVWYNGQHSGLCVGLYSKTTQSQLAGFEPAQADTLMEMGLGGAIVQKPILSA